MRSTIEVTTADGTFECFEGDLMTEHLRSGGHQRSDLAVVLSLIRPGDTVVDVGAHIGTFAVPMARAVGSEGKVIAFEPNPVVLPLLERNLARSGLAARVEIAPVALGGSEATLHLELADEANTGSAKLGVHGDVTVPVVRLDRYWTDSVALMKIDVEGAESEVLAGATGLVNQCRPVVIFEVHRDSSDLRMLRCFFAGRSYRLFVNLNSRTSIGPPGTFRLGRLARLSALGMLGCRLADIVALPRESQRMPSAEAALWAWAIFARRGLFTHIARLISACRSTAPTVVRASRSSRSPAPPL